MFVYFVNVKWKNFKELCKSSVRGIENNALFCNFDYDFSSFFTQLRQIYVYLSSTQGLVTLKVPHLSSKMRD